ncbi:MAG: ASCH domain-containing protein [Patescibacteria group bacterium]
MKSFSFGDSPEMGKELLDLVLQGRKTATAWAQVQGDFGTKVGGKMIIKDWQDRPRVLIETTELTCRPFNEVDKSFAHDEGEGDLSLEYWRREHQKYFIREGTFSDDMKVYCQRFKVIEILKI